MVYTLKWLLHYILGNKIEISRVIPAWQFPHHAWCAGQWIPMTLEKNDIGIGCMEKKGRGEGSNSPEPFKFLKSFRAQHSKKLMLGMKDLSHLKSLIGHRSLLFICSNLHFHYVSWWQPSVILIKESALIASRFFSSLSLLNLLEQYNNHS